MNKSPLFYVTSLLCTFLVSFAYSQHPMKFEQVGENAYVYISYNEYKGQLIPSNSMYVVTDAGVVLLDTPWDSTQFQPLLDTIESRHHTKPVLCVSTHFHADRTAGLEYYASLGIATWSSLQTYQLCLQNDEKKADHTFTNDTTFQVGQYHFEIFYPGQGHAPDNIVIWIPELQILYGGCFIKSTEARDLGNLSHADPKKWEESLLKVLEKYPDPAVVIPGHFGWSNKNSVKYTLKLVRKYLKK